MLFRSTCMYSPPSPPPPTHTQTCTHTRVQFLAPPPDRLIIIIVMSIFAGYFIKATRFKYATEGSVALLIGFAVGGAIYLIRGYKVGRWTGISGHGVGGAGPTSTYLDGHASCAVI